jgi:hypothetical protein
LDFRIYHRDRAPAATPAPLALVASCTTQSRYFRSGTTTISCLRVRIRNSFTSSSSSRSAESGSPSSRGVLVPLAYTLGAPSRVGVARSSALPVGRENDIPRAEALETKLKMWAASVSACEGWYVEGEGWAGEDGEESVGGSVVGGAIGAERGVFVPLSSGARSPVLWMIDPSLRERMRVDCTPGREVRWESSAVTCWGTCCERWKGLSC